MVTLWKQNGKGLVKTAILEPNSWIHVTAPTPLEIETLHREYNIQPDVVADILDVDERSRSEKDDDYQLIIIRIPVHEPDKEVPYYTIPLGILLVKDLIITVCMRDNPIISDFMENRVRNFMLRDRNSFLLHLFMRSSQYYLRQLKEINKQTTLIERDLQRSVKNNELVRLLELEKSLVFFTTSLKSNELLLEKLQKTLFYRLDEADADLLEDVVTEHKQAIEMSNIYSNILSGMMDAFASVISNNLNVVMKRLTSISLILMVPTLLASLYGMNVALPFQHSPFAFIGIAASSVVAAILGAVFFLRNRIL